MRLAPALALSAALLLPLVACQQDQTPPPVTPVVAVSPLIPPLPPAGVDAVPAPIAEAQAVFVEGLAAFQTGQAAQAAERFLAVAAVLARPSGEPHAEAFAQNRLLAYRNAAIAWSTAGLVDEARAALGKALEDDPQNREGLLELLSMLPPASPAVGASAGSPQGSPTPAQGRGGAR